MNLFELLHITDNRTKIVGKNIVLSATMKGCGILCSLVLVPMTLHYLTNEEYGIWLTLSSILMWFSFFDIGLGNGLRNYLTKAVSLGDYTAGRKYLSTTIVLLLIVVLVMLIVVACVVPLVNWNAIFRTTTIPLHTLRTIIFVASTFTLVSFIMKNIGVVYMALQKYAVNDLLMLIGNLLSLAIIFLLTKFTNGSLLYVAMAFTVSPVVVFFIAMIPLFTKHPQLFPSIKSVDFSMSKMLMGKGVSFFIIQITACLVMLGGSNIFITQFRGPEAVTVYNIAYKYFNILGMAFTIIIAPLWNAYTDAYVKDDFKWIKKTFKRMLYVNGLFFVIGLFMLLVSNVFYKIWVGDSVKIPWIVSLSVLVPVILFNFSSSLANLLNGLNIIKVQLYTCVFSTVIYIAIVIFLGSKYGIVGVCASLAICFLLQGLVYIYQCSMILNNKAEGIWLK